MNSRLYPQLHEVSEENKYTAVTVLDWLTFKGKNQTFDLLAGVADPNGSTNYDAAPIGSLYIWILAGSVNLEIKTDATTWASVGTLS